MNKRPLAILRIFAFFLPLVATAAPQQSEWTVPLSTIVTVNVRVDVKDTKMTQNMSDHVLAPIRLQLAQQLVSAYLCPLGKHVTWQALDQGTGQSPAAATVILTIKPDRGTEVMRFSVKRGSSEEFVTKPEPLELYSKFDDRAQNDPDQLAIDVTAKLQKGFTPEFGTAFWDAITSDIPIATSARVVTYENKTHVVMPIAWNWLRPASSSLFRVTISRNVGRGTLSDEIFVFQTIPWLDDDGNDHVIAGTIHECKKHRLKFDNNFVDSRNECQLANPVAHAEISHAYGGAPHDATVLVISYAKDDNAPIYPGAAGNSPCN